MAEQELMGQQHDTLSFQSMQDRWDHYCTQAAVACRLHQLRHTHATELINGSVSLLTICKRLGHKNLQTTLRYAKQTDETADAEDGTWLQKQGQYGKDGIEHNESKGRS